MNKIKNLFESPKKIVITIVCAIVILIVLGIGGVYAAGTIAKNTAIGTENAQNFAFADAGVDPASAQVGRTEFDFERGHFVYDVEFFADGTEYEYLVKASDGTILKRDREMKAVSGVKQSHQTQGEEKVQENGQENERSYIGVDEAKSIAVQKAGLSVSDVHFKKAKLDYDDGFTVYEIEFYQDRIEYECTIHAITGEILEYQVEED